MKQFLIPPIVTEQYDALCDLVSQSKDGNLLPKQVAEFLHKDHQWFLSATYNGMVPFAFGSNKGVNRGTSCIHTLPFFSYMTQGVLFRSIPDQEVCRKTIEI